MRRVVCLFALAVLVVALPHTAPAQKPSERAYVDAVLDGLVKAGVVTADQAAQIKKDAQAAAGGPAEAVTPSEKPKKGWTDTVKVSGYGQTRFQWYPDAGPGEADNELLVRRARVKVTAKPVERMESQFEIDLGQGEATVTDAWLQYDLDPAGQWRLRAGQQRVPFGFEVPQPTQSVLPLELSAMGRTMLPGSRDTGAVAYWTGAGDRELFETARKEQFGTGDYGNIAVGVLNGQGLNEPEVNDNKHVVLRLTDPFMLGKRYAEGGVSYWTGEFYSATAATEFDDELLGLHFYLPPSPLGVQAEYYAGETEGANIDGFYGMGLWRPSDKGVAFARFDQYNGPRKGRGLGNAFDRHSWSLGYAHFLNPNTKVTVEYDLVDTAAGDDDLFGTQLQLAF